MLAASLRLRLICAQTSLPRTRNYNSNALRIGRLLDRHPDLPLYAVIGANVAVFGAWTYAKENYQQLQDPSSYRWMSKHFLLNFENARQRPWTIMTCNFSHSALPHLAVNMLVLYSFGSAVISTIGPRKFCTLYAASALGTAFSSLLYHSYTAPPTQPSIRRYPIIDAGRHTSRWTGSLGASGCVTATSALFACLYPHVTIYVMFVLPLPAWAAVGAFMAYDMYQASTGTAGTTDVSGHLGGGITGLAYFWILRRGGMTRAWQRMWKK